ncbi:alpha/beta hydrolase domain-containing protein [Candidatus Blastococcus massiliensis]|uniref:alpha/beta hydrolase domain-containing protein n=1 Tax=Candidatus Blastococcus massiliensis TaxID=1470358 RepID=UPI0004BC747F|nr:alpha/beta hydrolase domain-containing protein [Candidatus Blastococcus massiliensis]
MTRSSPSAPTSSAITAVDATTAPFELSGQPWQRTTGTVTGVVDPGEQVAGLDGLPTDAQGRYRYTAEFEILAPAAEEARDLVLVEAENRGRPAVLLTLEQLTLGSEDSTPTAAVYPPGRGIGFLAEQHLSYARVQWETGIAAGVPASAQGIGEVVVRDFGRLLTGAAPERADLPRFRSGILAGISQSAWFVTTLVAEGFNVDPRSGSGVYAVALSVSGTGNWLAVNQLAGEEAQRPYLLENGVPLAYEQVLTRPGSDPLFVDVATYTDYYRLRASVTAHAARGADVVRYDWPAPHAGPGYPDAMVFGLLGCNGGIQVPRNPIPYDPYLRSLVARLAERLRHPERGDHGLPASAVFDLVPAPSEPTDGINGLPGADLSVPAVDAGTAQPLGGVRFPDAAVPLGRPIPVALGPVGTSSITDVCGNWGGWQPFTTDELAERYGDVDGYLARYADVLDQQIAAGYLRGPERDRMLRRARATFDAAADPAADPAAPR